MPFLYIDGTTGGMAVQILLASLAGGFVMFKLTAKSFFARFSRLGREAAVDGDDATAGEDREDPST